MTALDQTSGLRVLVVDDDMEDRVLLSRAIHKHLPEAKVVSASDGEEALQLLSGDEAEVNVIFLDLRMPKMNGIELLETLKTRKLAKDATVIVWSEVEDERMKWAAFGLDAMLFVEKATALEGIEKILKDIHVLVDLPEEPSLAIQPKAARG